MPSSTPASTHINPAPTRNMMMKLPAEVRMVIYKLCLPSYTAQAQYTPSTMSPEMRMDGVEFWLRNGYILQNTEFYMREVLDDDNATQHDIGDDLVYHKGHKSCDWDGKGTSYSVIMVNDDPDDLPLQAMEWMAKQGVAIEPCEC